MPGRNNQKNPEYRMFYEATNLVSLKKKKSKKNSDMEKKN